MNTPESKPEAPAVPIPCRFLRCNEMYFGAPEDDDFASRAYWCERTHEPFGPDGETCSQKQCCANRSCYIS